MNQFRSLFKSPIGLIFALLVALLAGCGSGGLDPILGTPDVGVTLAPAADLTPPTVTIVAPVDGAASVVNNTQVSASFSEDMDPATINASSFTVADTALGTAVAGTVSYSATSRTAIFTPSTPDTLRDNTQFTTTIGTAAKDLAGNALASSYVWTFTTAALADTTRPSVTLTTPAPGASDVFNNTSITATFSEDIDPSTLSVTSFVVTNTALATPVEGTVSYSVAARTATFTPSTGTLADNSPFSASITTAVTDLARNALAGNTGPLASASNYVWSFTTVAAADVTAPTVIAVGPTDGTPGMCLTKTITATFSEPMNADTINGATFHVVDANDDRVDGTVTYDPQSRIASFTPSMGAGFAPSRSFVATIESGNTGVKDAAGIALANSKTWSFTTGSEPCSTVADLGTAGLFGAFGGGAGVTNQGTRTTIAGNLGTTAECTLITGLHDAVHVYTETPLNIGTVDGSVYCGPSAPGSIETLAVATRASNDARAAYNELAAKPAGSDPGAGQLGGLTLPPGVYTAAGGTFDITAGDLILDAQGDPNATWVFQSAAALTVGLSATPRQVMLINGAQQKNVFWQVGSAARIEDRSSMVGTIIAQAGVTISTAGQGGKTFLFGRAIGLDASVTMVNTVISDVYSLI